MKKTKLALTLTALAPAAVMAEETAVAASTAASNAPIAAAITMAIAAAVVGFSQSRAAHAALEGIGRNPASAKVMTVPLILSLALMEALALLAFLVANNILSK